MYKDILKRKKEIDLSRFGFDRTKPAEEPKEPKRNEPKIKITGDETGELAYNLRQAEKETKTEATEEAKKGQSYLSLDLSPGKLFRTIETSNKFTLDKFNEKLSKEMMKIGKKNYPIVHVLGAIAYDGDPDSTLREAYDDAAEFLESAGKMSVLTEGLNGYKFLQQLAGELGTQFPTMTLGRTKGRIDRQNPSYFYVSDNLMK